MQHAINAIPEPTSYAVGQRLDGAPAAVETQCFIYHNGHAFEAGGAYLSDERIIAYLGKDGVLTDWHGRPIGTWKQVARWRIVSWLSSWMFQVEAQIGPITYTGRSAGEGMIYKGKRKAK